jgi:hypothetical protein
MTGKYLPAVVYGSEVAGFSITKLNKLRSAAARGLLGNTAPCGAPELLIGLHTNLEGDPEFVHYGHV